MTGQQHRVIADRDKGDDMDAAVAALEDGDRVTYIYDTEPPDQIVRIERPVQNTDEPTTVESVDHGFTVEDGWLVELTGQHTCGGSSHEWPYAHEPGCGMVPIGRVEDLLREHPSLPTRKQIAETLWTLDMGLPWTPNPQWQAQYLERADAVLALLQKVADR